MSGGPQQIVRLVVRGSRIMFDPNDRKSWRADTGEIQPGTEQGTLSQDLPSVQYLIMQVTSNCNMNCVYCYERHDETNGMSFETARRVIDYVQSYLVSPLGLHFFGGEPLLEIDLIRRITDYCRKANYQVTYHMSTNGLLLTDEVLDFLAENSFRIIISWDGLHHTARRLDCHGKDTSERVLSVIRRVAISTAADRFWVRITVGPHFTSLVTPVRTAMDAGINRFELRDMIHADCPFSKRDMASLVRMYEELALFYSECQKQSRTLHLCGRGTGYSTILKDLSKGGPRKGGCVCGVSHMTITPEGGYVPCSRYDSNLFSLGSVHQGIRDASRLQFGRRRISTACHACFALPVCGGPCHAVNPVLPPMSPPGSPYCVLTRKRMALALWLRHELNDFVQPLSDEDYR